MSIMDDPKLRGRRQYCGTTIENEDFMHEADLKEVFTDLEQRSLKNSVLKDSCAYSSEDADSVQRLVIQDTRELIHDLRLNELNHGTRSNYDVSEALADSIELGYDTSYELLDSASDYGDVHS